LLPPTGCRAARGTSGLVLSGAAGGRLAVGFFGSDAEEFKQSGGGYAVDLAYADDPAGELVVAGECVGLQ
jgi:hypothetical protein